MATTPQLRTGEDYKKIFDGKVYADTLFNQIEVEGFTFTEFRLKTLHNIFSKGTIKGKCLLEIGSGPCIHTVIPAAKWFDEIIMTDYSPSNRDMQEKWLKKDAGAHNWDMYFKYYSKLDGNEDNWQQLEAALRPKIKRVLSCDVHLPNPLDPIKLEQVDVICTSACLESACPDKDSYHIAMKNVVSLLKPGGKLILIGILNCTHYTVGSERFQCVSLTRDDVISTVKMNDLKIIEIFDDDSSLDMDAAPFNGSVIILAEKTST
ncbi:indolethylamine N-methyltransferase-like [Mytilus galloprovincialis]|uniref:indolethylamine N-methyltransferase-like n=1 Tax=Mytilus galloprovincialis TaxID=29158 RepID=UPI003F7BD244